jgi:hypothetical protein
MQLNASQRPCRSSQREKATPAVARVYHGDMVRFAALLAILLSARAVSAQVISFESNGLSYRTLTKNGVTVMFAHMPAQVRDYAILQIAVSNGSKAMCPVRPQDFIYHRSDGTEIMPRAARDVVTELMQHAGRSEVMHLVNAYEAAVYGISKFRVNNGYEQRRQAAFAEMSNNKLKAAAAASAIAFVPMKLAPGDTTDGAVFYPTGGKPLGPGWLIVNIGGAVFDFYLEGDPGKPTTP